jgi:hypothetical protein
MDEKDAQKVASKGRQQPAVKPGVVSISGDEVTTLDQRIAEKRAAVEGSIKESSTLAAASQKPALAEPKSLRSRASKSSTGSPIERIDMDAAILEYESKMGAEQTVDASYITSDDTRRHLTQAEPDTSAKQKGRSAAVVPIKPGAFSATSIGSSNVASELGGLEADILAKQATVAPRGNATSDSTMSSTMQAKQDMAAKQNGRNTSDASSRPGAFSATNSGRNTVGSELIGLEADIVAKTGAFLATNNCNDTVGSELCGLEADILSKQTAKPGAFSAVPIGQNSVDSELSKALKPTPPTKNKGPSANFELTDINDRIQAKIIGGTAQSSTSVPSELRDLDDKIQNKLQGDTTPSLLSVPSELRDLDDRIQTKISKETKSSKTSEIDALDDQIHAKIRSGAVIDSGSLGAAALVPLQDHATWEIQRIDVDAEMKSGHMQRHASQALQSLREIENTTVMKLKNQLMSDNVSPGRNAKQDGRKPPSGLMSSEQDQLNGLEFGEYGGDEEDGLAIAVAVEEGDNDMHLPAAVEYDPDAKPPMYRNRRFRMYMCLALTAVVVGTLGAVLGLTMTNEEAPQELPYRATLGIRENIARIVTNEQLDDYGSAYSKALDWIMYADPIATTPDNPNFFQRYLLAYFYYATSEKKLWDACTPPVEGESDTCEYIFLEDRLEDRKTKRNARRWLSGTDECLWAGIDCDNSFQVRGIELSKSVAVK